MKAGDLLHGPTLTAGRTPTIYSATVLVIFCTGASLVGFVYIVSIRLWMKHFVYIS